nr:LAGLIDADG homing endonuclease [Porodaedalea mongolica]
MLLCAGITSSSFKYSNLIMVIVTKLKQRSQSAGNFIYLFDCQNLAIEGCYISLSGAGSSNHIGSDSYHCFSNGKVLSKTKDIENTSETLRNKTLTNIKKVSIHVPTHLRPVNAQDFGHYLAGLIDGKGSFTLNQKGRKNLQLVIGFNELDASLAYYIKGQLGYGSVYKNKKEIILVVNNAQGLAKVIDLINGKLRSISKLDQIKNNILSYSFNPLTEAELKEMDYLTQFKLNDKPDLNNHWLSGFADATAVFQIKIIDRPITNLSTNLSYPAPESTQQYVSSGQKGWLLQVVRLNFQIDQQTDDLLNLIKKYLGGNIGYNLNKNTYYYSSDNFGSAKKIIEFFDRYHLLSAKHVNYLKWRKAYVIIQNKEDLTNFALDKIIKLRNSMNKIL